MDLNKKIYPKDILNALKKFYSNILNWFKKIGDILYKKYITKIKSKKQSSSILNEDIRWSHSVNNNFENNRIHSTINGYTLKDTIITKNGEIRQMTPTEYNAFKEDMKRFKEDILQFKRDIRDMKDMTKEMRGMFKR